LDLAKCSGFERLALTELNRRKAVFLLLSILIFDWMKLAKYKGA
jgi:hypothetical protein